MQLLASVVAAALTAAADVVVTTVEGPVRGVQTSTNNIFKGIPFAATTGGANRWRAPQPVVPWTTLLDATQYGPGCMQPHHNPDVPKVLSEDCLNINGGCFFFALVVRQLFLPSNPAAQCTSPTPRRRQR
jgi:para-nitrobenzyl esterase